MAARATQPAYDEEVVSVAQTRVRWGESDTAAGDDVKAVSRRAAESSGKTAAQQAIRVEADAPPAFQPQLPIDSRSSQFRPPNYASTDGSPVAQQAIHVRDS